MFLGRGIHQGQSLLLSLRLEARLPSRGQREHIYMTGNGWGGVRGEILKPISSYFSTEQTFHCLGCHRVGTGQCICHEDCTRLTTPKYVIGTTSCSQCLCTTLVLYSEILRAKGLLGPNRRGLFFCSKQCFSCAKKIRCPYQV